MTHRGASDGEGEGALALTTGGITILGVIVSIAVTVAFAAVDDWWERAAAGGTTAVALVVLVKLTTRTGRGPLARLARWTINQPGE